MITTNKNKMKTKVYQIIPSEEDDLKLEINIIGEVLTEGDKIDEGTAWHLCNYTCWNGDPERKLPEVGSEIKWDDHIFIPGWKYFKYKKSAMKCLKNDTHIAKITKRMKESKK